MCGAITAYQALCLTLGIEEHIESSQPHEVGTLIVNFSEDKTEARSDRVTCPKEHPWWAAELGLEPRHLAPDPVLLPVLYRVLALFASFTAACPGPYPW